MSFGLGDVMVSITGGDYMRCGLEAWWSGILGPTSVPGPEELGELQQVTVSLWVPVTLSADS